MLRRKIKIFVIVFVFFTALFFGLLFWSFNSPITSFPNRLWQYAFWRVPYTEYFVLRSPYIREYLGFVNPGDERYDFYRDNNYTNIIVELYLNDNETLLKEVPPIIEASLSRLFKDKKIILHTNKIFPEEQILTIYDVFKYRSDKVSDDTKVLYIAVTNQKPDFILGINKPYINDVGGAALSSRSLLLRYLVPDKNFSRWGGLKENEQMDMLKVDKWIENTIIYDIPLEMRNKQFEATIIHEVGHLLGLRHRNEPGCVMDIESYIGKSYDEIMTGGSSNFVLEFCEEEKKLLNEISEIPLIRTRPYLENYYFRKKDF